MLVLMEDFHTSGLFDEEFGAFEEHDESQIEDDTSETQQDQSDNNSTETAAADAMALEPEADPYKRLMNRINHLMSTGSDEDILYAYQLAQQAVNTGRFNYDNTLAENLNEVYLQISNTINDNPALRTMISDPHADQVHDLVQPSPSITIAPAIPTFIPTHTVSEPRPELDDNPYAFKLPGVA